MDSDKDICKFYAQTGGSLPYFAGIPQQYGGGGILRNIARFAFPLLKRAIKVVTNTAEDVLDGNDTFKNSLINNAANEVMSFTTTTRTPTKRKAMKRTAKRRKNGPTPAKRVRFAADNLGK